MEDWNGKTCVERDPLQRVKSVKDAFGRQVRYAWDEVSNRIEVAYPEGGTVRYGYDGERRNTSMRDAKGLETGFRFDAAGNLVEKAYPNGERTAYAYDPNRRLREMKEYGAGAASPMTTVYDWDAQGNRTGEAVERDGEHIAKVFGYDVLNRLIRVEEPQGVQQYAYDGLGNLVRESGPEYARRYEYSALNQLVRREETRGGGAPVALAYEYDLRGNRVRERSAQDGRVMKEFAYDGANRMVRGETEKGSSFYRYDGLGRRVGREWEQGSERKKSAVQYVVDFVSGRNDDLAAYTQGFFAQSYSYANGQRIQQVTKAWENTANQPGKAELPSLLEELYIHEDIMGSARRWSTASGDTYAQIEYDVWGLPVQSGNEEENILNPRYTNHTYDDVLGMYHAQFRFLDATNRGFTAVDPIKDGLNWYGYCEANPTTYTDPLGLDIIINTGGSIIDANNMRDLLSSLTGDDLTLESYNANSYRVVLKENPIGTKPLGTELIRDIYYNGHFAVIESNNLIGSGVNPANEENASNGIGTHAMITLGITSGLQEFFYDPKKEWFTETSKFTNNVTLAHELIHAYHVMTGTMTPVSEYGFALIKDRDRMMIGYLGRIEELRTAGISYFELASCFLGVIEHRDHFNPQNITTFHSGDELKYTENKIRAEQDQPIRGAYASHRMTVYEHLY